MKVIVIDSGIDYESNKNSLIGGTDLIQPGKGIIDDNGHGSRCASIIRLYSESMPSFYSIKALNLNNESSTELLVKALNFTKELDIRLINLSLATQNIKSREIIGCVIEELYHYGKIVVASVPNSGQIGYPASMNHVIGVDGAIFNRSKEYWYNKYYPVQCVANRIPVLVRGYNGRIEMFGGTSKATAIMTAIIGNILEESPNISYEELENILQNKSLKKMWDYKQIQSLSRYIVNGVTAKYDSEEKEIEELILKYLIEKGLQVSIEDLHKYGYQCYFAKEDFCKIIQLLEKRYGVQLSNYEGIEYRVFENARCLNTYFKSVNQHLL